MRVSLVQEYKLFRRRREEAEQLVNRDADRRRGGIGRDGLPGDDSESSGIPSISMNEDSISRFSNVLETSVTRESIWMEDDISLRCDRNTR